VSARITLLLTAHGSACLAALIDSLPTTHPIRLSVQYVILTRLALAFGDPMLFVPPPAAVLTLLLAALRRFLRLRDITDALA